MNELKTYNPELSSKQRIIAISKCDMLDEELIVQMKAELPEGIRAVFISSVSGLGIMELKDVIWEELNKESNKIVDLVHRPMIIEPHVHEDEIHEDEEDMEDFDDFIDEDEEDDDISKYKGIGWDDL